MSSFTDWSKARLEQIITQSPKEDWEKVEYFHCRMGVVESGVEGWSAWVYVGSRLGRVKGKFDSASVAMGVVERVWKREGEKRIWKP